MWPVQRKYNRGLSVVGCNWSKEKTE